MAKDIVGSLFGVTPEMYQQRQAALADERALQYAKLDPFQQAQYAIGRGAYGLAGALGGALGAQDPQLQLISQRNAIARQIDYSSPMSIMEGQRTLARLGDTVGAMQLASVGRDLEYKQAQTSQSMAAASASRAQAAKSQAEIDEIDRQQRAFAALTGKAPAAAAPAEAMPTMPTAAPTPEGELVAAPISAIPSPVTAPVAADAPAPAGETSLAYLQRQFGTPGAAAVAPAAAAPATAAPAAAPAAAAPAQTRATLNQQIAALEDRRGQMLALTKVPAAKAEAEILGDRIKDLRSQLKPTEFTNLEREIDELRASGVPDTDPRIKDRLDKKDKLSGRGTMSFGEAAERVSKEKFFKPYAQLTQEQAAAVNAVVEERLGKRAKAGAAVFPGDKALADIPAFRASVQRTIDPQLKTITASDQALQAINDSLATGNFAAYRAAQVQFARAIAGAGDLSQKELKAAGADPSLLGGAADVISTAFTGTPSADTQKKIRDTLQAIQTVARKQARGEVDQQRKIALRSPGYNAEAVNEALTFPQLQGNAAPPSPPIYARNPTTGARIMSTDGGTTWTSVR